MKEVKKAEFVDEFEIMDLEEKLDFGLTNTDCSCPNGVCQCPGPGPVPDCVCGCVPDGVCGCGPTD